jgi:hypothetical protein
MLPSVQGVTNQLAAMASWQAATPLSVRQSTLLVSLTRSLSLSRSVHARIGGLQCQQVAQRSGGSIGPPECQQHLD